MKIILHIGAPKAGSSAIQAFIIKNRLQFERYGYYCPEFELDKNGISSGHDQLGGLLIQKKLSEAKILLSTWIQEAEKKKLSLLLSSEYFYGLCHEVRDITFGFEVNVIAFFRDPIDALISGHNQTIKRHFCTETLYEYAHACLNRSLPTISGIILKEWAAVFGNQYLLVFPYVSGVQGNLLIEDVFLSALDISNEDRLSFDGYSNRVNASYTPEALELKRIFNHVLDSKRNEYSICIDLCLQNYSDNNKVTRVTAKQLLGSKLFNAYANKFMESNAYLKQHILAFVPKGFLDYTNVSDVDEIKMPCAQSHITLEQVLRDAFSDQPELLQYLLSRVTLVIDDDAPVPYEVYRLAELLGLPFKQVKFNKAFFLPRQLDVLVSDISQPADLLREVSAMLEQAGQYEQAFVVISRALALRPKGTVIVAAYERLRQKIHLSTSSE